MSPTSNAEPARCEPAPPSAARPAAPQPAATASDHARGLRGLAARISAAVRAAHAAGVPF